jgi:hypothetical protein
MDNTWKNYTPGMDELRDKVVTELFDRLAKQESDIAFLRSSNKNFYDRARNAENTIAILEERLQKYEQK